MEISMSSDQTTKDKLLHKVNELTEREIAIFLSILQSHNNDIIIIRNKDYLLRAIDQVNLDEEDLLDLLNDLKGVLLPRDNIDWITKDLRTSLWFYNYYQEHLMPMMHFASNDISNYEDYLITGIDCSFILLEQNDQINLPFDSNDSKKPRLINRHNFYLENKIKIINNTKALHHTIFTENKYIDWIDVKNTDQLYWAIDYLRKVGMLIGAKLFLAQTNEDMFARVCASLDAMDNFHNLNLQYIPTAHKKYFISSMRKAWSQKKFRDKKDVEAAQDLLLNRKAKKQLLELSSAYGISSVEMLTNLIDAAYQDITVE